MNHEKNIVGERQQLIMLPSWRPILLIRLAVFGKTSEVRWVHVDEETYSPSTTTESKPPP